MRAIRVTEKAPDIDRLSLGLDGSACRPGPARPWSRSPAPASTPPTSRPCSAPCRMPSGRARPAATMPALWSKARPNWVGKEVWGSGGELGIRRDGTHGEWLVVPVDHLREKPAAVTLLEAGAIGVPFITAWAGLEDAGGVKAGDVVLVLGANGKVGQAAIQLATMAGARVFGVERTLEPYRGHASGPVEMIGADTTDIAAHLRDATDGHGADIVYNTVGSPYFAAANRAMAIKGRQIFISTIEKEVPFDIFAFYRGRHRFVGIDTLALDSGEGAQILDALEPGFESGRLKPFPVLDSTGSRSRTRRQPTRPCSAAPPSGSS